MSRKSLILIVSIFAQLHIHTMDEPMDIEKSISIPASFCYLANLPGDIWDLIAYYLTFDMESEEEFIERTKTATKKNIPLKYYYKDFQIPPRLLPEEPNAVYSCRGAGSILTAFCPNEMNVALLNANNLKIVNIKKDKLIHEQNLVTKDYQHIALSRNAAMFATIHSEEYYDDEVIDDKYIATIMNISSKKTQQFDIPDNFRHSLIAFNKQGTYIILHGVDYTRIENLDPMPHHLIFPITVNEQDATLPKKTLQHYFQQRGVCNDISSSIAD